MTQRVSRVTIMIRRGGWAVRVVVVEVHLYAVYGVNGCVTSVHGWVATMVVHALQGTVLFRMQGIYLFPCISNAVSPCCNRTLYI